MSDNLNKDNISEEIDLLRLFEFFEHKIKKLINLILGFFKSFFNVFILFLKIIQRNTQKIAIVVIAAFILGFVYDMYKPKIYTSKMMIKPMFNSKYQMFTNIEYYNALILDRDYTKLTEVFDIDIDEAKNLTSFTMVPGPENENEKIKAYDDFIKSVDSSTAKMVDYDQFIEQMSIYNSSLYEITVSSKQKDVFLKLFPGFSKTFETEYSKENKKKKDEIFNMKKATILKSLKNIDSLKNVYINTLTETQNQRVESFNGSPLMIKDEQKQTKEYEALNLEIKLRKELNDLEEEAIEEDKVFEVISGFQAIGTMEESILTKMKFMFPAIAFILMLLGIFGIRFNKFIANYKID